MAKQLGLDDSLGRLDSAKEVQRLVTLARGRFETALATAGDPFAADDTDEMTVSLKKQIAEAKKVLRAFFDAAEAVAEGNLAEIGHAVATFQQLETDVAEIIAGSMTPNNAGKHG